MNRDTIVLVLIGIGLAGVGFWFFNDILGSLLGAGVGLEAVRKKKQASKVKSAEADKRQEYHQEKAQEHADKAEEPQKEAQEIAKEKDEPIDKKTGYRKRIFRSE